MFLHFIEAIATVAGAVVIMLIVNNNARKNFGGGL